VLGLGWGLGLDDLGGQLDGLGLDRVVGAQVVAGAVLVAARQLAAGEPIEGRFLL